jgi:hypothetical protein
VSLANQTDVLLVECKYWNSQVKAEAFLTLYGRVLDIGAREKAQGREIRGAIVTRKGAQAGVYTLTRHYGEQMSLFTASSIEDLEVKVHTHFIYLLMLVNTPIFYPPTIPQPPPD